MAQYATAVRPADAVPLRTPVEQGLLDAFGAARATLPGDGWVARVRGEAIATFAESGLPTARAEAWHYTDLRRLLKTFHPLPAAGSRAVEAAAIDAALGDLTMVDADRLVLVDGQFRPDLSRTDGFGAAIEFFALGPLLAKAPAWLEGKFASGRLAEPDGVSALNTALMSDGLLLKIKPSQTASRPLVLVMARSGTSPETITTRNLIAMEQGSKATIVEVHVALAGAASAGTVNTLTDVVVADGAALAHVKVTAETEASALLSHWGVRIGAAASYRAYQLTLGTGGLARHGIAACLAGAGSSIDVSGAFLTDGATHTDTTMLIDHEAPGCTSREVFKGVLAGRSRGIFQGKVVVRPGAQKTDGKQMAQALLLSPDAEFDSKPELEIYADDVACGHGSTSAEIDQDHIFYLRARGIPEPEARAMLTRAFVAETLDKVEHEALRSALAAMMDHWLDRRTAA